MNRAKTCLVIFSVCVFSSIRIYSEERVHMQFRRGVSESPTPLDQKLEFIQHFGDGPLKISNLHERPFHISFLNHSVNIKDLRSLGSLTNIHSIDLGQNPEGVDIDVETCDLLGSISGLKEISFFVNDLSNRKIEFLRKVESLQRVVFGETLTGGINFDYGTVEILKSLKSLKYFELQTSRCNHEALREFLRLSSLNGIALDVGESGRSSFLDLDFVGDLDPAPLQYLNCRIGSMTVEDVKSLGRLRELNFLEINGVGFSTEGLKIVSGLKQLKVLRVEIDQSVDSPFLQLSPLTNLEWIQVRGGRKLNFESLQALRNFRNLRQLQIEDVDPTSDVLNFLLELDLDWVSVSFEFDSVAIKKFKERGFQ